MPFDAEPPTTSTDLRTLQRARDIVATHWTRYSLCGPNGNRCLLGALGQEDYHFKPETLRAVQHLGFDTADDVHVWNDAQPSNLPVLDRIDAAIARLGGAA